MTLKIAEIGMNHMGSEKYFLKYFKLPAPTLRVSPKLKFYPFFI